MRLLKRRRRIPFVPQMEAADCGAACLAMVLGYHGRETPLAATREAVGSGRRGASARDLVEAARRFGLQARGVQLDVADLEHLPAGSVLHWGFDHFVVLAGLDRRGAHVVDPALGLRIAPLRHVREKFTGVALLFEPGPGFEARRASRRTLGPYFAPMLAHSGILVRTILLSAVLQVQALALPVLIGTVVDRVVPRQDWSLLGVLVAGFAILVVFHVMTLLFRSYLLNDLRTRVDARLSFSFMDHLARLPYGFFVERPSGDLLQRFESNRALRGTLTAATLSAVLDGVLVFAYLFLLFAASVTMGALVVFLGLLQIALFLVLRRPTKELAARELEAQSRTQSHLVDMLAGMESLKALGAEQRSVERWSHLFVAELNASLERARIGAIAGSLASGLTLGAPIAILLTGATLVLRGELSLGTMLMLNALAVGFLTPLGNLVAISFQLQEARGHIERIADVLDAAPERDPAKVQAAPALAGAVALENVSFRYAPKEPWAVHDVTVSIPTGKKVAIVGRSGAGKSTLARLLVGLYRPEAGRILYDGHDLETLDLVALRGRIGVVTQDARVFGTSLRSNIALADPGASQEEVAAAARIAEIHEDIAAMPLGYDTILTDGGTSLSGGQRQRIALARALLRRPVILLLDEATSDLDAVTEASVMANLAVLRATRIVIAHRLSTVADADSILVLEQGAIVEAGTHEELLAAGGVYAQLVAARARPAPGQP